MKSSSAFEAKYDCLEELGKGAFGVVNKCRNRETRELFAAKFIRKTEKSKREVTQEINVMNKLNHQKLIKVIDFFESEKRLVIVMELVPGRELFEKVIEDDFYLSERKVVEYIRQILHGLQHMHEKNIVHLDLKPENILCMHDDPTVDDEIKLIDFGLSRELQPGKKETIMCGTPEFVAPEVIAFDPVTLKADMWSVGVIAYVLLSGTSPFLGEDDQETLENVAYGEYDFDDEDQCFENVSQMAKQFIMDCLEKDPRKRISVKEAIEHEWMTTEVNDFPLPNVSMLKNYLAKRRWQRVINAVRAIGRFNLASKMLTSFKAKVKKDAEEGKENNDSGKSEMINNSNEEAKETSIECEKNKMDSQKNEEVKQDQNNLKIIDSNSELDNQTEASNEIIKSEEQISNEFDLNLEDNERKMSNVSNKSIDNVRKASTDSQEKHRLSSEYLRKISNDSNGSSDYERKLSNSKSAVSSRKISDVQSPKRSLTNRLIDMNGNFITRSTRKLSAVAQHTQPPIQQKMSRRMSVQNRIALFQNS